MDKKWQMADGDDFWLLVVAVFCILAVLGQLCDTSYTRRNY